MLPYDDKPWAKTLARLVIAGTLVGLTILAFVLNAYNLLHIPEFVAIFLLLLTIIPPNLAVLYPSLLPSRRLGTTSPKPLR